VKNTENVGDTLRTVVISANLSALKTILANAEAIAREAHDYALRHERNSAIGTMLVLDTLLADARALYAASLAIHRSTGL